jgi:glutathione S-transferase
MARTDLPVLWQLELSHYNNQRPAARMLVWAAWPLLRIGMRRVMSINAAEAFHSRARTIAAMDRLERELGSRDYLVGDWFTIADLTAASIFYPIIRPATFPYPSVTEVPAAAQEFLDSLAARPGGRWVAMMYERHRAVD